MPRPPHPLSPAPHSSQPPTPWYVHGCERCLLTPAGLQAQMYSHLLTQAFVQQAGRVNGDYAAIVHLPHCIAVHAFWFRLTYTHYRRDQFKLCLTFHMLSGLLSMLVQGLLTP